MPCYLPKKSHTFITRMYSSVVLISTYLCIRLHVNVFCFVLQISNLSLDSLISIITQVVILLLTEITPKSIAVHNATEVARFVVSCNFRFWKPK